MKLRLLTLLVSVTLFSACSSVGHKNKLASNDALSSFGQASSYESAVTIRSESEQDAAIEQGLFLINSQIQQDLAAAFTQSLDVKSEGYTSLEKKVRSEVVSRLPEISVLGVSELSQDTNSKTGEITVWSKLNKSDLLASIEGSRMQADQDLLKYIHLSSKGTNLKKLLTLTSALPTLELKNQLGVYASYLSGGQVPQALPNDRLGALIEDNLSSSFANFSTSLSASSDESAVYEKEFANKLSQAGLNVGSYRADLIIKYFIETNVAVENGLNNVTLVGDSEMVNADGVTFATVGNEYAGSDVDEDEATKQALAGFSNDIVEGASSSVIEFMDKATEVFNR